MNRLLNELITKPISLVSHISQIQGLICVDKFLWFMFLVLCMFNEKVI